VKNLRKIYRLAYGFGFFVTFTSGRRIVPMDKRNGEAEKRQILNIILQYLLTNADARAQSKLPLVPIPSLSHHRFLKKTWNGRFWY